MAPDRQRPYLVLRSVAVILLLLPAIVYAQTSDARAEVMILGTPHFANPGLDVHNFELDDVLAPKRQAEIEGIVRQLAAFKPTKIAIEAPYGDTVMDGQYQRYRAGNFTLSRDERHQIAFRLAKMMGHAHVYPVDYQQGMDMGKVMEYAASHGQEKLAGEMQAAFVNFVQRPFDSLQKNRVPLAQVLLFHNRPVVDTITKRLYLLEARVGKGPDYPGADDVGGWYLRNMKIFVNLSRVIDSPSDRVIALFGSGHGPYLREYVRESGEYSLVPVAKYLH
jgi:hypothetical protein